MLGHQAGSIDVGDLLFTHTAEDTLEHGERDDARVVLGQVTLVADLELRRHTLGEAREQASQCLGKWEERLDRLGRLVRIDVHRERHEIAG